MPKNVIVSEGGRGRRFANVSRLMTDKTNGLDSWVPTSERMARQKYIRSNGVYHPQDDGLYGFSKLTVNIPGGAKGYTVPTVSTAPYGVETVDTSVEPSLLPSVPGSVGSSVVGMDPDTGLMSVMTVNPDGTLSKRPIPTSIRVLIPPAKLSYHDGEKIQYAGLVVELLDPNGDNFQDELFPQGIISWSPVRNLLHPEYNLITPTEYAEVRDSYDAKSSSICMPEVSVKYKESSKVDFYKFNNDTTLGPPWRRGSMEVIDGEGPFYIFGEPSRELDDKATDVVSMCSPKPFRTLIKIQGSSYVRTLDAREVYAYYPDDGVFSEDNYLYPSIYLTWQSDVLRTESADYPLNQGTARVNYSYIVCYGDNFYPGGGIPVSWNSPYDGNTYSTSFEIEVS